MAPQTSTKLTYEDYLLLPDDGRRHEILDGELYVNPAPNLRHQLIAGKINGYLLFHFETHGGGYVFGPPTDVLLGEGNIVQPDGFVVLAEHSEIMKPNYVDGPPDIVVEVLSGGTRRYDEIVKRKLYEQSGVQEYWIADPEIDTIRIYRSMARKFERTAEISAEAGGDITSPLLPGFRLDVRVVFAV